jgi:hypothetical protein
LVAPDLCSGATPIIKILCKNQGYFTSTERAARSFFGATSVRPALFPGQNFSTTSTRYTDEPNP